MSSCRNCSTGLKKARTAKAMTEDTTSMVVGVVLVLLVFCRDNHAEIYTSEPSSRNHGMPNISPPSNVGAPLRGREGLVRCFLTSLFQQLCYIILDRKYYACFLSMVPVQVCRWFVFKCHTCSRSIRRSMEKLWGCPYFLILLIHFSYTFSMYLGFTLCLHDNDHFYAAAMNPGR